MSDWTMEELVTAAGTIMRDLRGSWDPNTYSHRMYALADVLTIIIEYAPPTDKDVFVSKLEGKYGKWIEWAKQDLVVTQSEISDPCDGRVFRDACHLYERTIEEGQTERVRAYLRGLLEYPEYTWVEEGED